jgi:hypothetical protein
MAFHCLYVVVASEAPISVHDEGHMLRNGTLLQGADEKLP